MGPPRLSIGTYGTINLTEVQPGKWRARTRYRFADGKARQIEKYASTKARAETSLKQTLLTVEASRGGTLTPTTPLRVLGQKFLAHKRDLGRSEGNFGNIRICRQRSHRPQNRRSHGRGSKA